jgi:hypothetical protein
MGMPPATPPANRRHEGHRLPAPANLKELIAALARLRGEAVVLADEANRGIQRRSYRGYWKFRSKLGEQAALLAVVRSHAQQLMALEGGEARLAIQAAEREEIEIFVLAIRSSLRFGFALSANPTLPLGARETFVNELQMLGEAGRVLEAAPREMLPEGVMDDLATARMILEEIIEKSPPLADFGAENSAA